MCPLAEHSSSTAGGGFGELKRKIRNPPRVSPRLQIKIREQNTHPFEQVALVREVVRVQAPVVRLGLEHAAPSGGGVGVSLCAIGYHLELGEALPLAPRAAAALNAHLILGVHP